jgi:HAD superfamily hydrolase (TIGR01484 family)
VVTDLDGTLWRSEREIDPRVRSAWSYLVDHNIAILAASGRRVASMRSSLGRHGLRPAAVALNGAVGIHLESGERFHNRAFEPEIAVTVLESFRAVGLDPCIYVDHHDVDVYVSEHPATHRDHLWSLGGAVQVGDLENVATTSSVLGFGLVGCRFELLQAIVDDLDGKAEAHLDRAIDYEGGSLTVAPWGVSKWVGVVAYCRLKGINERHVLAIGDGPNDVELLKNAAISISLEGSHPAALAVAQHVVSPVDKGGWVGVLDFV